MELAISLRRGRQLSDNVWLERMVRLGFVVNGVVHLLIAWLALQLAFGNHSATANQEGALHELAGQEIGALLLWVVAVGLFALALWQLTEVLWGHRDDEGLMRVYKRLTSAGTLVAYAVIGYSAVKIAVGAGSRSRSQEFTARLMAQPFGRYLVAAVGVVILVIAVVHGKKAMTKSFVKDLERGATSGSSGTAIVRLGQVGYFAKGVAFGVLGALFIWAAWTYDAKKAGGLDAAMTTLLAAGPGPWLLAVVALGIGCFGVYSFARARYPKLQK